MRIGLIVELPTPNNFQKQIKLFEETFPEYQVDLITCTGIYETKSVNFNQLNSCSKLREWLMNTLLLFLYLFKYLRKSKPDVILNMSDWLRTAPIAMIVCRTFKIPLFIRIADSNSLTRYKFVERQKKIPIYLLTKICKISIKFASMVIVLGPNGKRNLIGEGFSEDKLAIIPPFINKINHTPTIYKKRLKKRLTISEEYKIILFVGRVTKLKGGDILEKVAKEVTRHKRNILFLVLGEGEYKERLNKIRNVRTIGFVDPSEINKYYEIADLLILPSKTEGLPNVILEAVAHKVPVLASNVGEIPWIVSNTVEPNDWRGFTRYILQEDWGKNNLPKLFARTEQRKSFEKLFRKLY